MQTEQLTYEEKTAVAMDAIVNWCWNTENHLKEARRLKVLKLRLPQEGHICRRWSQQTQYLMDKIKKELTKAEPDILEEIGFWSVIYSADFLDQIPWMDA